MTYIPGGGSGGSSISGSSDVALNNPTEINGNYTLVASGAGKYLRSVSSSDHTITLSTAPPINAKIEGYTPVLAR